MAGGVNPGVRSSYYPAHQEADGLVYVPFAKKYTFKHSDLDSSDAIAFPIPAGSTVLNVTLKVTTAFDNAADVTVGDSADADGYILAADVDPTAKLFIQSLGGTAAFARGKNYESADRIIVDFTANPAAGEAELCIFFAGDMA